MCEFQPIGKKFGTREVTIPNGDAFGEVYILLNACSFARNLPNFRTLSRCVRQNCELVSGNRAKTALLTIVCTVQCAIACDGGGGAGAGSEHNPYFFGNTSCVFDRFPPNSGYITFV